MADNSQIQWTNATWNPWHGCHKVSDGCKFCYMFRDKERHGQAPNVVLRSKSTFNDPLKWREPKRVFTCSWSDFFIAEADEWRAEAWEIIKKTSHLTYQILTKRPENIVDRLPDDWGRGYENVWLGVSVENQNAAFERIPILLDLPAKIKFLSLEPLLEPIDLTPFIFDWRCASCGEYGLEDHVWLNDDETGEICPHCEETNSISDTQFGNEGNYIDWAIIGGESGNQTGKYRFRPCEIDWINNLVHQFKLAEIPVFVKQLGTHLSAQMKLKDAHGGDIAEFPADLQIREFPAEAAI